MQSEELIRTLAMQLQPVRRLRPPLLRALLWLTVVAAISALAVDRFGGLAVFARRVATTRVALECVGVGATAVTAIIAAFVVSVPGRSLRWGLLVLPGCALWLGASGLGCLENGWSLHGPGGFAGDSPHCFLFIVGVSVPLSLALFAALRRARPIAPLPVAALGTLGVAALAAFVLEFFHPFDVTVIDLALHLAAVAVVMLVGIRLRRRLLVPG